MKRLKKGDWARWINPLFARRFNRSLEGIVVEDSHPYLVQVLYTGDSSPVWVDAAYLEKIEVQNE